jgi:hypothetical protein
MAINFPNAPTLNSEFSAGDRTWVWNGTYWEAISTTIGYSGSQGNLGYTGSAGAGYTGSTGTQGNVGFTGSTGTQGNVGFTGSAGSTGTQGSAGFTGSAGSTGTQGNIGFTGSTGTQGNIGFTGSIGYTGSRGVDGVTTTTTVAATIVGTTSTTAGIPGYADKSYTGSLNDGYTLTNGDLYVWKGGDVAGSTATIVEYLIVAGGGAGAYGGGGGGGVLTTSGYVVAAGSPVSLSVGDGGVGATNPGNSTFASFTAIGGGRGGSAGGGPGASGGSGGGASYDYGNAAAGGGAGTAGQGNRGGHGSSGGGDASAGGGGGAGGIGTGGYANGTNLASGSTGAGGGAGGIGLLSSISGSPTYYGGGGGGGGNINGGNIGNAAPGGLGGGGNGATTAGMPNQAGTDGTPNTGGGGGGGDPEVGSANFKRGGSGIVIIRYADTYPVPAATTGSPTAVTTSGYRIYSWTTVGSGSITFANNSPVTGQGWVLVGNIKGIPGEYAAIGYTGSAGVGYTGSTGTQGSVGYTGSVGSTGTQGSIGFTGYSGSLGYTGSAGSSGSTGTQGIIGFTGSTGTQGNVGFTGSAGTGYTGSGGAVSTGPKITSVTVTDSSYNNLDDTAVALTGGYIKIAGSGFESGCQVLLGTTLATSVSYISSTEVRAQLPAASTGTYIIYLVNADGGTAIRVNAVTFSPTPSWTTGASLVGAADTAISIQLAATDATSYSVEAGSSLPSGVSLSSGGLLSGTITGLSADTIYNFTIIATDAELQDSTRAFTFTITIGDDYFEYVSLLLAGNGTNNANNNTFLDSSTNNFAITRNGNTTQGTFSPYGNNWSNFFTGSSYLTAGTTPSNFLCTGSATGITATFEAWVYLTAYNAGASIWMFSSVHSKGATYFNFGVASGKVRFYWYDGGYKNVESTSTSDVPLNTWTHIALTISGSTIKIYVNGILNTTSATYTGVAAAGLNQNDNIGVEGAQPTYFTGYISNYRLSNTVVYSSAFTPSTTPLTAISGTRLLICQSNRFIDNSTNAFAITLTGSSTIQRFSPFSPPLFYSTSTVGGSVYFDGTTDYLSLSQQTALSLGTGDFTVEAWVYPTANPASFWSFIDARGSAVAGPWAAGLRIYTGNLKIEFYNGTQIPGTITVPLNAWAHVAFARSGTTLRGFVNGVLDINTTMSTNLNIPAGTQVIGAIVDPTYNTGYMTDFRVVKGTAVYTSAFTPPTSPLTAVTNTNLLLNYTNAGIIDNSMMNNLETVGDVKITTALSKFGSGSLVFDGTGDWLVPRNLLPLGSGNFTVEMWLYPNATYSGAYAGILDSRTSGDGAGLVYFGYTGTANQIGWKDNTTNVVTGSVTLSTWNHVAIVRSNGTMTMYVNGTSTSSSANSTNYTVAFRLIGASFDPLAFNGYIDDLRITTGYARYTATFTPPTSAHPLK